MFLNDDRIATMPTNAFSDDTPLRLIIDGGAFGGQISGEVQFGDITNLDHDSPM
ncbi:hypothetical protein JCM19039_2207 [Geomicrobium sp. JCM 19039]|nr:hypothetical protein JCM19039_2207 [Geomicrobium sp. JCM 19039]